jgi:rubrerythrin
MPFRRGRFVDLVERQLDLFSRERAGLIGDTEAALRAYDAAERDEAEERYGDYLDLVETGQDELVEIRESYAATLDEDTAEEYRAAFNRLARRRLPRFTLELDE